MPWEHCSQEILDDLRCPTCGCSKPAWTLRLQRTRDFVVSRPSDVDEEAQVQVLQEAAEDGTPFCEECAKAEAEEKAAEEAAPAEDAPQAPPATQAQQATALQEAAEDGTPFCEECAQAEAEEQGASA